MSSLPIDYRDEFQAIFDFISETMEFPEHFRSYHWVLATEDRQRFADSSAMVGGPIDMSPLANAKGPGPTVRHHLRRILSSPCIYAVDVQSDVTVVTPKSVLEHFREGAPDLLFVVTASGQRVSESAPWTLNMAFIAVEQPEQFLAHNATRLAKAKPLLGSRLYSKKDRWT